MVATTAVLLTCLAAGMFLQSAVVLGTAFAQSERGSQSRPAAAIMICVLVVLGVAMLAGLLLAGPPLRPWPVAGGLAAGAVLIEVPWLLSSPARRVSPASDRLTPLGGLFPAQRGRPRWLAPATSAVLVVAVIAAAAVLPHILPGRPTPRASGPVSGPILVSPLPSASEPTPAASPTVPIGTPTDVAPAQAATVSSLLATGAASAVTLTNAVDNVGSCTDLPGSIDSINAIRDQRQAEYSQAQSLATGALPNGAALKSDLVKALSFSLKADDDYLAWANQHAVSCQPGIPPRNATSFGNKALRYKTLFVGLWNPLAVTYGLPTTITATI